MRYSTDTIKRTPVSHRERHEPTTLDKARGFTSPTHKAADKRTAAPVDAAHREAQRRSLLRLRARVRGDISQTADEVLKEGIEFNGASPDSADMAYELAQQDVAAGLLGSASGTVEQIEAALDRIDEGNYGICEECGTKIPAERLEAVPYATQCVRCAARLEAAKALHG